MSAQQACGLPSSISQRSAKGSDWRNSSGPDRADDAMPDRFDDQHPGLGEIRLGRPLGFPCGRRSEQPLRVDRFRLESEPAERQQGSLTFRCPPPLVRKSAQHGLGVTGLHRAAMPAGPCANVPPLGPSGTKRPKRPAAHSIGLLQHRCRPQVQARASAHPHGPPTSSYPGRGAPQEPVGVRAITALPAAPGPAAPFGSGLPRVARPRLSPGPAVASGDQLPWAGFLP